MTGLRALLTQIDARLEMLRAVSGFQDSERLKRLVSSQLAPHFAMEFAEQERSLVALLTDLGAGSDVGAGWQQLALCARELDALYDRFLRNLQAEIFRNAGLDQGTSLIADALLGELAGITDLPWRRRSMVGSRDAFELGTEVIHVRFPQYTIWLVPLVAHELGHFAVSRIRRKVGGTGADLIAELARNGLENLGPESAREIAAQRADLLEELFADVFATWLVGPAYAYASLLLALNPTESGQRRHPPAGARADAILKTLERLDGESVGHPYASVLAGLREVWPALAERGTSLVDVPGAVSRFLDLLHTRLPPRARYEEGWAGSPMIDEVAGAMRTASPAGAVGSKAPIRVLLNAAWRARVDDANESLRARIGSRAHALILDRAGSMLQPEERDEI